MPPHTVLLMSSFVARGGVGISGTRAPLDASGIEVIALPTTLLSNHPGHRVTAGNPIPAAELDRLVQALDANGWLGRIDMLLTGYLPSVAHVDAAARLMARVREASPNCQVVVDPVLGDDPGGLYIGRDAAAAVRGTLLPLADIITPNRFELAWLSGRTVTDAASAVAAARALGTPAVFATSVPGADDAQLHNILIAPATAVAAVVARRPHAPHGTGDLFTGLVAASLVGGASPETALAVATGGVAHALDVTPATSDGTQGDVCLAAIDWKRALSGRGVTTARLAAG